MREIKFRAWDKNQNVMMNQRELLVGDGLYLIFSHKREMSGLIPMQYTGQKDENGKEIYEGDILDNGDYMEVCFGFNNGENEGWYLKRISDNYEYTMHAFTTPWNVIGNIHENPELLKK